MDPNNLKNIRVLVVEDDEDDWLITKKIFSQIKNSPFQIEWAPTYDNALEQIDADTHDVYLLDYRLGAHTGTDLLAHAHPERRRQPFILMTGVADSDLEWKSLKLAAADYLVKGSFDAVLLSRTLYYALQRKYIEQQRIDQLIELNQAKEEFISIASHQLRTPATGVKQYIGMVIEGFMGEVPAKQLPMLKQAYESNERQLRIINDLLKVAQIDSGKLKLHHHTVDINQLVSDVVREQRQIASNRKQRITFTPLKRTRTLELDKDIFRMVFENIIDNACKYSHNHSTITVELSETDEAVHIAVMDEGVGIDKSELHKLYGKFTRINNPLSAKVGGSGLGLYWAKHIVDRHGGTIAYSPNKPKGSTFVISLPKRPSAPK